MLYIAETIEFEHADSLETEDIEMWIGDDGARIRHAGGEIVFDRHHRRVASYDDATAAWTTENLWDWEHYIDDETERARRQFRGDKPKYARIDGESEHLGLECRQFSLRVERRLEDGSREEVRQDLWVTRRLETTALILRTYQDVVSLFDQTWIDLPVERPEGFVLRAVTTYDAAGARPGEAPDVETITVHTIEHVLVARSFLEFAPAAMPAID